MSIETELENQIAKDKKVLERGKALRRLLASTDFKSVVVNGFLREHALHLVYQRAASTEDGDKVSRKIDAVAEFKAFLDTVLADASIAEKTVAEATDALTAHRNHED